MVYITSDLFGPTTTHDRQHPLPTTYWPALPSAPPAAGLGKRKRLGNDDTESPCHQRRATVDESSNHPSYPMASTPTTSHVASEKRPFKQIKRLSPKAALVKSTSHLMDLDLDLDLQLKILPTGKQTASPSHAASDLRPCHACKLAPKRRKDLENYLDCRRCDGRTCYICARQCQGGCRKSVCKKCVVEVGHEGHAWCLDCYSRHLSL